MIAARVPRAHAITALALLSIVAGGCAPGLYVEGTIAAEATLMPDLDEETMTGTATVTLVRPSGDADAARVTIMELSAELDLTTTFKAEHPGPLSIEPGGRADVRFRVEGTRARHETPWGLACDHLLEDTTSFLLSAKIFDSERDAHESTGLVTIRGEGTLHRAPPPEGPPRAEVGAAWSTRLGGPGADFATGIAVDDTGDLLVAGKSEGGIDLGGGPLSEPVFLGKLDASSGDVKGHILVASGGDGPLVATDGGITVVAATFTGSIAVAGKPIKAPGDREGTYVARLGADGSALWVRSFAAETYLLPSAISVDPSGNVIVAGSFVGQGAFDVGGGPLSGDTDHGAFVLVLGADGAHLRSLRIDGLTSFGGAAVDATGALLLTGTADRTLDFGGATLPITGPVKGWLAKLDAAGAHVFSETLPWVDTAPVIAADEAGNVLVADGLTVTKLDPAGAPLWQQPLGAAHLNPTAIAVDDSGRVLVAGAFTGATDVQGIELGSGETPVFFVAELDANGVALRAGTFGCASLPIRLAHRAGVPGVALVGGFHDVAALDQGSIQSLGNDDVIVAKLSP